MENGPPRGWSEATKQYFSVFCVILMLMGRLLLIIACLCWALDVSAQSFRLEGRVVDEMQVPLEFCTVSCAAQGAVTMTNLKGEFALELQSADSVVVRFSLLGYRAKTRVLRSPRGTQKLRVMLSEDNTLGEVTVTELKRQTSSMTDLKAEQLRGAPSASGNAVESLIQTQAGVSTHNELSSQYNVRGGSFDENAVYLNSIELYRPFLVRSGQQEGLSAINSDMVEGIAFSTGGFPAKYGDKMSSALDITYKRLSGEGRALRLMEGSGTLSLLGASLYAGLASDRLSWTHGLRYKTNSYLLGTLETKGEYRPRQVDYQTYLSWCPTRRWTVDVIGNVNVNHYDFVPSDRETSFGTAEDVKSFKVYFDGAEQDVFRTYFGALSVRRELSRGTDLTLIGSAFTTTEQETYDIEGQYWLTQTDTSENLAVGTYFQHARNYLDATVESVKMMLKHRTRCHAVELGVTLKHERVSERSSEYEMRDSAGYSIPHTGDDLYMVYAQRSDNTLEANRVEGYAQDTWRFGSETGGTRYTLNYGCRVAYWSFNGETVLSPRASLAVVPAGNNNLTLRVATGVYYQAPFYKELRDTTTANNITYVTLNRDVRSQRSIHLIGGVDYHFRVANRPMRFTAEAYYKALANFIPYTIDNMRVVYYSDKACGGHAAGLDMKIYGQFVEGADSWLTLSLMNTRMNVDGVALPLPTDQRFAVNFFFTDYFPGTDRWKMSLKLAYADGLPFNTPHKELQTNTFRAPAYKRVDIGMTYRLGQWERSALTARPLTMWLGVDALNLLGINNVNSYYWVTDVTNNQYAVPNYLTGRQLNLRFTVDL